MPRGLVVWFVALFVVTQLPLFLVRYPDIVDFPNHLARLHVLAHLDGSELLSAFYMARPGIAPNLALDTLVPLAAQVIGLELALKAFASVSALLMATGVMALTFSLNGRLTALSLGSLLFAHNAFLHLGLFNFVFGIGAALWLLAAWIRLRLDGAVGHLRMLAFTAGATALYLCHLSAIGTYLVAAFAFEAQRAGRQGMLFGGIRVAARVGVQAIPALALHVLAYEPGTNLPIAAPESTLATLVTYKLALLLLIPRLAFNSYPIAAGVMAAPVLFLLYRAFRINRLRLARGTGSVLAGLLGAMLLLPPFGFGSNMVDMRMALPIALVLWAGLATTTVEPRVPVLLGSAIAAGVLLSSAVTLTRWTESSERQAELRQAMLQIPEGSSVAVVVPSEDPAAVRGIAAETTLTPHAAAWSVIDRSVLLSSLFIRPYQPFPLAYRPEHAAAARLARLDNDAPPPHPNTLLGRYDFVLVFGPEALTAGYSSDWTTVYHSSHARLMRAPTPP